MANLLKLIEPLKILKPLKLFENLLTCPKWLTIFAVLSFHSYSAVNVKQITDPEVTDPEINSSEVNQAKNLNLPALPEPVTNNAVASVTIDGQQTILSFAGLPADKKISNMHNKAWKLDVSNASETKQNTWQTIAPLPSIHKEHGRLAATAVGMGDSVYIMGGYNLSRSKSYDKAAGVYKYHVPSNTYAQLEPMPVSVNDAVALTYRDRYIYLISGWNNDAAVNLVQVYDALKNEWFQASPFIGIPVFGHAGGIVDNVIMICDGAAVTPHFAANKTIDQQASCYLGEINVVRPNKIDWYQWVHPTDEGRFRMAAAGDIENDQIIFVGGAQAPHNFDGVSYQGKVLEPTSEIWTYNISKRSWKVTESSQAIMNAKSLIKVDENWVTIGGMIEKQKVTGKVIGHIKKRR